MTEVEPHVPKSLTLNRRLVLAALSKEGGTLKQPVRAGKESQNNS
jgi:hypothetical protein